MIALRRWLVFFALLAFAAGLGCWLLIAVQYARSNEAFRVLTVPVRALPTFTDAKWQDMNAAFESRTERALQDALLPAIGLIVVGVGNLVIAARLKRFQPRPVALVQTGMEVVVVQTSAGASAESTQDAAQ